MTPRRSRSSSLREAMLTNNLVTDKVKQTHNIVEESKNPAESQCLVN